MIDLLAAALDLSEPDRTTLRTWYERHNAPYHVIELVKRGAVVETMQVINVVNDQPYCVRLEMQKCPFIAGQIVIGSLVPWRGEWYWSGGQRMWHKADAAVLAALKKEYVEKLSVISYRYCGKLRKKHATACGSITGGLSHITTPISRSIPTASLWRQPPKSGCAHYLTSDPRKSSRMP